MNKQLNTQFTAKKKDVGVRLAMVDLIRIVLALLILTTHGWWNFFEHRGYGLGYTGINAPGYNAVEAFFMLSGFFIARAAYKQEPLVWHKYMFRKLWYTVWLFLITMIFALISFGICSISFMEPYTGPIEKTFNVSWFVWFLLIAEAFLYPLMKKFKDKFTFATIAIAIIFYLGMYFWTGLTTFDKGADPNWFSTNLKWAAFSFLRATAGVCVGTFIYAVSRKTSGFRPHIILQILFTLITFAAAGGAFYYMFMWAFSSYDFIVIIFAAIILFIIFCNLGLITRHLKLPDSVCLFCRDISLYAYMCQYAIISLFEMFGEHNEALWGEQGWIVVFGLSLYFGVFALSILVGKTHKLVQQKLLPKFKRLNNI